VAHQAAQAELESGPTKPHQD